MIATEGFDIPECDAVLLTRPTKSLALYLQMIGRALRPKEKPALILDACGLSLLHGMPEEDRQWTLAPRGEPKPGKEWPLPVCEDCGTANQPMRKLCVGCGIPRWHTCERCSKPIFHTDGPDTECARCNPMTYAKLMLDSDGKPIWDEKRDRPQLGWVKLRRGEYAGLFGGVWKPPDQNIPLLAIGTVVSVVSRGGKKRRCKIAEFQDHAPFGQIYILDITVKDAAKKIGAPAGVPEGHMRFA